VGAAFPRHLLEEKYRSNRVNFTIGEEWTSRYVGTGPAQHFPHPRLLASLSAARVGVETMATPAACRTFNILSAEGRRAIAALIVKQ